MFNKIKKIIMFLLFSWYRKGNRIYYYKDNKKYETFYIKGLTIRFKGKNSIVIIEKEINFKRRLFCNRSIIKINGNYNIIKIRKTDYHITNLKIINIKNNNKLKIGKDFYQTGKCIIDFCNLSNKTIKIGNNCMFGIDSRIMCGDFHKIYDLKDNKYINKPNKNITIGNNVWLSREVLILKDAKIPNNTIVGARSVVTKEFLKENTIIAGIPSKIVKNNIKWEK